jgi:hypothetical protein
LGIRTYLLSLPERLLRSASGLGAGLAREVGEVAIPKRVRESELYRNLVDATLRYLIEQVGGVEGVYAAADRLPDNFLARRTAGNVVEALGIVAFRASPVWILAALSDVCGMGRHLIPEIADALKAEDLLDKDTQFATVDQMLDGLERTSSRLAATVNTPPLDVASLRRDWQEIRQAAQGLKPGTLPSWESISGLWTDLTAEARRQGRSVFETSSMMAVSAVRSLPQRVGWLSASARVGAGRTGRVFAAALLDDYRQTLKHIAEVGYAAYAARQFRPYVRAAIHHFSPKRRTLTERGIDAVAEWRRRRKSVRESEAKGHKEM